MHMHVVDEETRWSITKRAVSYFSTGWCWWPSKNGHVFCCPSMFRNAYHVNVNRSIFESIGPQAYTAHPTINSCSLAACLHLTLLKMFNLWGRWSYWIIIVFKGTANGVSLTRFFHSSVTATSGKQEMTTYPRWTIVIRYSHVVYDTWQTRCNRRRQTSPPVPPLGELDETYTSSLILVHSLYYISRHPRNPADVHSVLHCR